MGPRGVLTSIEPDSHLHGLATAGIADAGIAERVRSIQGEPADVAGRLTDGQYDLVLLQGDPGDHPRLVPHAERLLRPGGLLVARRVLVSSDGAGPVVEAVSVDPWAEVTVLPMDDGLLMARRAPDDG